MEFTGIVKNVSKDLMTNETNITFSVNEGSALAEIEKLKKHKKLRIKVVQYRKKRSLDANAYCWKLMSEIANVLRTSKEEIYKEMLVRYGTNATDDDGNVITVSVPSNVNIKNADIHCAFMGKGYVDEKEFNHYRVIKGSSMYDTKEMSILIDGVVSECKELEIETLTPRELEIMKGAWGNEKHNGR